MASCKLIRWCAPLFYGARGRGFSTQSLESLERTSSEVLAALEPHVDNAGKPLLRTVSSLWKRETELLSSLWKRETELWNKERQFLSEKSELLGNSLRDVKELLSQARIDLLKARGLNDTRGLFERIQESLRVQSHITPQLKGAGLWEAILRADAGLAMCIQKYTGAPISDVKKQALNCYNVYSILSQHIHAGKSLAELKVAQGGTIKFERGPLSPEQVKVLLCMGVAARVTLQEST